jgi:nucleoside-diphosphate-sugar epimerase
VRSILRHQIANAMRVLVTGATGFVGSHLTRLLVQQQCEVTALVRPTSDLWRISDIRDHIVLVKQDLLTASALADQLRERAPELCFHLAWFVLPGTHPSSVRNVDHVAGSMKLLEALDTIGCKRTVMTGTCLEQDTSYGSLSEQTPIKPQNFYSACKHALHVMAEFFQSQHGRGFAWARLFNTYGPYEYEGPLVPDVILKLLQNTRCPLTKGDQLRDYLHVEDVARALWAIGRSDLQGAVNVGSSEAVSVATVAELIGKLMNRADLLGFGERPPSPFDCRLCCANGELLRTRTGWRQQIALDEGIAQTIRWWEQVRCATSPRELAV